MSWRVVTITGKCKLECRLEYLVCKGDELIKVHLSEISVVIIESTTVAVTASLLCELLKRKIKVIFCDERHNPLSELVPMSLRYDTSGRLRRQLTWTEQGKKMVWTEIVKHKIFQQMTFLKELGHTKQADMLLDYMANVQFGDVTNREGHSAKVYFNAMFGMDFARASNSSINSALDYGYSILLSAFNREVAVCGYTANLGVNHNNEFNHFNLSCDLMEPFRPLVDRLVMTLDLSKTFSIEHKHQLQQLLNTQINYEGKRHYLNNAIGIYVRNTLDCIVAENTDKMSFYTL